MDTQQHISRPTGCKPALAGTAALVCYVFYSVGFLLSSPLNFTHTLIAKSDDSLQWLWFFNWFPYAVEHGINPLFCPVVWTPAGLNLTWTTCTPVLAILCWPITAFWGPFASYNLVILMAPALAAWAAYLLCREMTGRFFPSLVGGFVFGFSPYELGQLGGHLNLVVIWPVPLLVWLLLRWYRNGLKDLPLVVAMTGLLLFLFGTSVEIFTTTVVFGGLVVLIAFLVYRDALSRIKLLRMTGLLTLTLVLVSIMAWPYLRLMLYGPDRPNGAIYPTIAYSVALANVLIPTRRLWIDGGLSALLVGPFPGNIMEQGAYVGLPLVTMWLLFGRAFWKTGIGKLLICSAGILFILSLGPWLIIARHPSSVPLPWLLFNNIPLMKDALPARLSLYVALASGAMAAVWLADAKAHWRFKLVLATACILFLLPNVNRTRLWRIKPQIPAFFRTGLFKRYLRPRECVLLLPLLSRENLFWQAECKFYFRIGGGYLGLPPPAMLSNPVVRASLYGSAAANYPFELGKFIRRGQFGAVIIPAADEQDAQALRMAGYLPHGTIGGVKLYLIQNPAQEIFVHLAATPGPHKTNR